MRLGTIRISSKGGWVVKKKKGLGRKRNEILAIEER